MTEKTLSLNFHGRVIDHLGIQMYQSPTAAIAEMVSNAWDADAESVKITFPEGDGKIDPSSAIVISDDGHGMTFDECQRHFLTVGFDRRKGDAKAKSKKKQRPVMGRKGIGKFAGFGIATKIEISTVSEETGEHTIFLLDLDEIRKSDNYIDTNALKIKPTRYELPDIENKNNHGTTITLTNLKLGRKVPLEQFRRSMARRFIVNQQVDAFEVSVNGVAIPVDEEMGDIEFSFPKDYREEERPPGLKDIDGAGWGAETLSSGVEIRWRILFKTETIKEEEHQGVAVFAHKKLAQRPCMFNLSGGLTTQTGPEYMTGAVIADFVDEFNVDIISTERQRLNWDSSDLQELQEWGQDRIKKLLSIWKRRRGEDKILLLNKKMGGFRDRIDALAFDGKTVESALKKLASIEKISSEQFNELANALLTAWESGRLKGLIHQMSQAADMSEADLLTILIEADTIQALHTAESVRAKLNAISGLERRIRERNLENAVRDYIAKHPWLISPKWETFAVEKRVQHIVNKALEETKRQAPAIEGEDNPFDGRVDLILSSGDQLLVMEFMRPGLKIDLDHLNRFEAYINTIEGEIDISTALPFKSVSGYLVADKISKSGSAIVKKIKTMQENKMFTYQWDDLLAQSKHQWKEFLGNLADRNPYDPRLVAVKASLDQDSIKELEMDSEIERVKDVRQQSVSGISQKIEVEKVAVQHDT